MHRGREDRPRSPPEGGADASHSFLAANETTTWVASGGSEQLLVDIVAAKVGR